MDSAGPGGSSGRDSEHAIAPAVRRISCYKRVFGAHGWSGLQFGNFRDTAATRVTGKTNEPLRASSQLGHAETTTIATGHYIDAEGYIRPAVDKRGGDGVAATVETGAKLESGGCLMRSQRADLDVRQVQGVSTWVLLPM